MQKISLNYLSLLQALQLRHESLIKEFAFN